LKQLVDGEEPDDPVASKIRKLVEDRLLPLPRIVAGVDRMKDVPFSGRIVDQAHARAAMSGRFHSRYGLETVRVRSLVSLLNLLLSRPTSDEKALQKVRGNLLRLEAKRPGRIGAQQFYVKVLIELSAK
jgi:hypothetical protein